MNRVFERRCYDPRRSEVRLLALIVFGVLAAGVFWHAVRGAVVHRVACTSIGTHDRTSLIATALRDRNPEFPDDDPPHWVVSSTEPDWIGWPTLREDILLADGLYRRKVHFAVADRNLTVRGAFATARLAALPFADRDGDGSCEVVMEVYPADARRSPRFVWLVVLRLLDTHNEIVWIGRWDRSIRFGRGRRPHPMWRDEDGDGQEEFVLAWNEVVRTPSGGIIIQPPRAVAVFEWTAPGGTLRGRSLPDDCIIVPWDDDGRAPLRVDQTADLDELVRELLPAE
jgi:hypothetical protein